MSRCSVTAAVAPSSSIARARDFQATFASAWVAIAPTPATAAGTAEPTARNFDATATPHDSPSADRATIENVMARTLASRSIETHLPSAGLEVGRSSGAPSARLHDHGRGAGDDR